MPQHNCFNVKFNIDSQNQLAIIFHLDKNHHMEKINLPTVVIERSGDDLKISHNRTGMTTTASAKQLDSWAVQQLRKELLPPKPAVAS